jgi:hypothetical protein
VALPHRQRFGLIVLIGVVVLTGLFGVFVYPRLPAADVVMFAKTAIATPSTTAVLTPSTSNTATPSTTDPASDSTVTYAGYDGGVLVSIDRRTITIGGFGTPCFGTVSAVANETARRVALLLHWTTPKQHGVCTRAMAMIDAMDVVLQAPLGVRVLVNGRRVSRACWRPDGSRP